MQRYDGTASSGYFADSAQQLAQRLEGDNSARALELADKARRLETLFREWTMRRPSDEERVSKIRELFEHNRHVLDYLANAAKAGANPSSAPSRSSVKK